MVQAVKKLDQMLSPEFLVQNTFLFSVLVIFLTMYGPRLHPKLPESLKNLFSNPVFRGVVLFLIAYLSSKNFQSSIVITIIFLVTMNLLHTSKILEKFRMEGFSINGPPVASCNTYNKDSFNLRGTAYYPLHDNDRLRENRLGTTDLLKYNKSIDYLESANSLQQ